MFVTEINYWALDILEGATVSWFQFKIIGRWSELLKLNRFNMIRVGFLVDIVIA